MKKLSVFYSPKQSVEDNKSFSPSAGKPKHIVELFSKNPRVEVIGSWKPVTEQEIAIAHNPDFVKDILTLQSYNGFGNRLASVAASLPYTVGSFVRAAEHALVHNTATMSPTSGFHHSGYDYCGGFCTFNGLMVTALHLWQTENLSKLGIIDFDAHYGDGTQDIINKIEGTKSYVQHYTFGHFAGGVTDFDMWLDGLYDELVRQFRNCEILLYQAGADPHVDDPLGGYLTTKQMKTRDDIVFRFASNYKKPIVWNLAGGYQDPFKKVLKLHHNTLESCLEYYTHAA